MDRQAAVKTIKDTFESSFDKGQFIKFSKNLLKHVDESGNFTYSGNYIPDAYEQSIQSYDRIGKYEDADDNKIDVLIVRLKKQHSLEHARTRQRNFVAWYLKNRAEKDAALVAFVSPESEDWRFSLVRMDYNIAETPGGKVKVETELTPARRYSFLVGENESSHTAQVQLLDILQDDGRKPLLSDFEKAFSIEVVNREFLNKYRELFHKVEETLQGLIEQNKRIREDFEAKGVDTVNFAKKLLGQIVFLYFLQKKGWLGVAGNDTWGQGDKRFLRSLFVKCGIERRNFFNDFLEYLFYDALNREDRGSVDPSFYNRFNCKIPFLNGGLFDPINNYDWAHTDILLPNGLFSNNEKTKEGDVGTGILDVFDRYNFTVKEDEPLDKEVAVDPEMLGKVFENLLEVKDRKSKGNYYTPREIVHYMCQESLINYLDIAINTGEVPLVATPPPQGKLFGKLDPEQGALKAPGYRGIVPREGIEAFVRMGELAIEHDTRVESTGRETRDYSYKLPPSIRLNAALIDDALASIRVCDPAIGSGAFPVGLMTEIVRARNTLTTYLPDKEGRTNYNFKRHAIQNCLYGVDIDAGAVEITKLRLWLSLVVDEEDIKQIQPLPNLDYKIVCGNSLLGVQRDMFNDELFKKLEELIPLHFSETNAKKKQVYKIEIDNLINQITNNDQNFDFKVYFSNVFHEKSGFDVVIANPPYLGEKGEKEIFQIISQSSLGERFYLRRMDLFYFFIHLAIDLGGPISQIAFITTDYYPKADGARKLRCDLKQRTNIRRLIDFNELRIFESAQGQHNMISILSKGDFGGTVAQTCMTRRTGFATPEILQAIMLWKDAETAYFSVPQTDMYENNDELYLRLTGIEHAGTDSPFHNILSKAKIDTESLGTICDLDQGIVSGADKVTESIIRNYPELHLKKDSGIFVLDEDEVNNLALSDSEKSLFVKPFYKNSDIHKWRVFPNKKLFILYIKDEGESIKLPPSLEIHFEKYKDILVDKKKNCFKNKWLKNIVEPWLNRGNYFVLFYPRSKRVFENLKIVNSRRAKANVFAIEEEKMYEQSDIVITTLKYNYKERYSLQFILCLLNSRLSYFWLYHKGKRKGEMLELFQTPLSKIPIKRIPRAEQKPFIEIVDKILAITKDADYLSNQAKQARVKELERQIDQMVYELYGLTPEEIGVVEGINS